MRIDLEGGYVETVDETYKDVATNELRPFWKAVSQHEPNLERERFHTRALAAFSVWVIHERVASENSRKSIR